MLYGHSPAIDAAHVGYYFDMSLLEHILTEAEKNHLVFMRHQDLIYYRPSAFELLLQRMVLSKVRIGKIDVVF